MFSGVFDHMSETWNIWSFWEKSLKKMSTSEGFFHHQNSWWCSSRLISGEIYCEFKIGSCLAILGGFPHPPEISDLDCHYELWMESSLWYWWKKSIGFFPSYLKGLYPVAQVVIAGFLNHQEQESLEWVVKHHYSKFITIPFERNNWKFFAISLLKSSQITLCKFWQNDDQNITNTSVSVQYTQYVYVYIYFFCYT